MSLAEQISPLLGRWVLAWFFLSEAWARAGAWRSTISLMNDHHIPAAQLLLVLALIVMILGGLSLLLGYHTRHGALMLFAFTILATILMHDFWRLPAGAAAADYEIFSRNIAIAGGLLMAMGMGAGPFALDNRQGKKRR